jgi:hypothetical protein
MKTSHLIIITPLLGPHFITDFLCHITATRGVRELSKTKKSGRREVPAARVCSATPLHGGSSSVRLDSRDGDARQPHGSGDIGR